jgi:hypothetical protein
MILKGSTVERSLITRNRIDRTIVRVRGRNVMLDVDLALLYGVTTRELVQAVKRNPARFPHDFMFRLNAREFKNLRSQNVISSFWGGRRTAPYAFTEQGVAMLSAVLRSSKAVRVNIEIMRAFVRLRRMLESHDDLVRKLEALEAKYDSQLAKEAHWIPRLSRLPTQIVIPNQHWRDMCGGSARDITAATARALMSAGPFAPRSRDLSGTANHGPAAPMS